MKKGIRKYYVYVSIPHKERKHYYYTQVLILKRDGEKGMGTNLQFKRGKNFWCSITQ